MCLTQLTQRVERTYMTSLASLADRSRVSTSDLDTIVPLLDQHGYGHANGGRRKCVVCGYDNSMSIHRGASPGDYATFRCKSGCTSGAIARKVWEVVSGDFPLAATEIAPPQESFRSPTNLTELVWAVRDMEGLTIYETTALIMLASRGDAAWPSLETLASDMGCSRASATRAVSSLVDKKLVTRTPRLIEGKNGIGHQTSVYQVNMGRLSLSRPKDHKVIGRLSLSQGVGSHRAKGLALSEPQRVKEKHKNEDKNTPATLDSQRKRAVIKRNKNLSS